MIKEGDIVMCTVKSIEGTSIFLQVEEDIEGSMTISEVAAGRIRNLREYVSLNKKVVCKVLKISHGHAELSLRRVTGNEREEILKRYKKERTFINMLKVVCKDYNQVLEKIKKNYILWEFFDKAREDNTLLEKAMDKNEAEKLSKMINEKEGKDKEVKKIFSLQSYSDSGVKDIKEILDIKDVKIRYLGSSRFSIISSARDFKEANNKIETILKKIETLSKDKKANFEVIGEK